MGKLLFRSQKITLYLVLLVSLVAVAAVACGSDDDEVAPTAAAQPTAQPTAAQAAATNTPAPAPVASTGGPSGKITAALESVGVPIGTPGLCVPGCANEKYFFSAFDTLVHCTADKKAGPGVAVPWVLASALSKRTWHIR